MFSKVPKSHLPSSIVNSFLTWQPFVRVNAKTGEATNVLLMDTQGMFDMQTPPALTAAIFGLSTLISSYQIYNIPRQVQASSCHEPHPILTLPYAQIQEDTLQQLHFFTEFSLCALREYRASRRSNACVDFSTSLTVVLSVRAPPLQMMMVAVPFNSEFALPRASNLCRC